MFGVMQQGDPKDRMNFILDNPDDIKHFIPLLTAGAEVNANQGRLLLLRAFYLITLVDDNEQLATWQVNLEDNYVLYKGRAYTFDAKQIRQLAKDNRFKYKAKFVRFSSKEEANSYLKKQLLDRSFIVADIPPVIYDGNFQVRVSRNNLHPHSRAAIDSLKKRLERVTPQNTYIINYVLNQSTMRDRNYYTFLVRCNKEVFESFSAAGNKAGKWRKEPTETVFFYRTH
ncbi:hypothetical protein D3H65_10035 [Paraflavitalea soli]|uniref:Uncharacterized protein n=2 Tax=Paraflavitalea soli TaxID=2315862 RepID=A0A3B7MLW8_9BACT|nr:hypothetical protein D3H65_10035 [Paraflavitalea soli]